MSDEFGWWRDLTTGDPAEGKLIGPNPHFFGRWTIERFMAEVHDHLLERHRKTLIGMNKKDVQSLPPGEPTGELFMYPHLDFGLSVVFGGTREHNLASFHPAGGAASQHWVRIERAHLYPDRLHAIIKAELLEDRDTHLGEGIPIQFFDSEFAVHRGLYRVGKVCNFVLSAFAQQVAPSPARTTQIPRQDWMRGVEASGEDSGLVTLDLSELAAWLHKPELGAAAYEFRGKIESIKAMLGETDFSLPGMPQRDEVLGVQVRRVRTLILREPDILLDIMISSAVEPDLDRFQPGDWIEGVATMAGEFCYS